MVVTILKNKYDEIASNKHFKDYLKAIQNFESISENEIRNILTEHYKNPRSRDQAWKNYKGILYEYAVFKLLKQIIDKDKELNQKISLSTGEQLTPSIKEQIVIKNWNEILPDVDILIIDKNKNIVKAIISCKTSLRERLTETAFWRRELEKHKRTKGIKIIFITTDKDNELKINTNRYILLHVIDYTFITDPKKYDELEEYYTKTYGTREDFMILISKIKPISNIKDFIKSLPQ
ncbi:MAG: BsaWI family type II restriction enzyme [Nitrososphaeria archaeon]